MAKKDLRDYQIDGAIQGVDRLNNFGLVYYAWSVRTGKTATSLECCREFGAKYVLFLTKKKALGSIQSDYIDFGFDEHFEIDIINDESMHKIVDPEKYDIVVHDEHHRFAGYPKLSSGAQMFISMFYNHPQIYLSGTPCPESYTQMFNQFRVSVNDPWKQYNSFYKWAKDYVDVRQKKINSFMVNDYTRGIEEKIMGDISHIMLTRTQEESGFQSVIDEKFLYVDMSPAIMRIQEDLINDKVVEGKSEVILADTPAKLMQKLMQLEGGTMKFESGNSMVLDTTKAEFIKNHFSCKKIAIFYTFKEELNALRKVFGENLTIDIDEFNSSDKNIVLQVVSGREGISLAKADYLVFYNIQHSAVSYWQARDRLTTMDRPSNTVFWVFSNNMIGQKIYKVVQKKKSYTTNVFKKDYSL